MASLYFQNKLTSNEMISRIFEREEDLRGCYFRDATAIIHSYPFRRLKHKTQVFFSPKNDHICTRIEHVMHVASISTTICRALDLDGDLAWAIGLGHDLGHAPFGHLGEAILTDIMHERGIGDSFFSHEINSLRVVDHLTRHGKGLNLTYAVRDGILNHCGEKFEQSIYPDYNFHNLTEIRDRTFYPSTWEGCVVRMSDKIAYMGRDMEDALQLKIIKPDILPKIVKEKLGDNNSSIINTLVTDLIKTSLKSGEISFSDEIYEPLLSLKDFNYNNIYRNKVLKSFHNNFERILKTLYEYLERIFTEYGFDKKLYLLERNLLSVRFYDYISKMKSFYQHSSSGFTLVIVDYISGMADEFAIESIKEIMIPSGFESQFEQLLFE